MNDPESIILVLSCVVLSLVLMLVLMTAMYLQATKDREIWRSAYLDMCDTTIRDELTTLARGVADEACDAVERDDAARPAGAEGQGA